ncbi:HD domain-containing phosphohydrolase [Desulfomarina sp.]
MPISTRQNIPEKKVRFSLALTIGTLFSILLVVLGICVTYYSFQNQKKTALNTTKIFFAASAGQIEDKLLAMIQTVESFVTTSSALGSFGVDEVKDISSFLPYFHRSFQTIPWMTAIYVGRDNGSFYMVESIRNNPQTRKAFSAPDQAAYAVKIIGTERPESSRVQLQFFNKNLKLITTRSESVNIYDPRKTTWYGEASSSDNVVITRPYTFFTSRQLGITLAHSLEEGNGVVGADTVLSSISQLLQNQKLTPSTQIVIMEENGRFLLSADKDDLARLAEVTADDSKVELNVTDLHSSVAGMIQEKLIAHGISTGTLLQIKGRTWFCLARELLGNKRKGVYLTIAAPLEELMVDARKTRQLNVLIVLVGVIVALGVGVYLSRRIACSLHDLAIQAESVRDFQLSSPFTIESKIREVADLSDTMTVMQSAINRFVEIARALSAEKKMERVLEMILHEARSVSSADGGGIGLVSDDGKSFSYVLINNSRTGVHLGGTGKTEIPHDPLLLADRGAGGNNIEITVIHDRETKAIDDISGADNGIYTAIQQFHEKDDYICRSLLVIPLLNRQDEVIGLLHLVNARDSGGNEIVPFSEHKTAYVKALSSNAALALDNNRLIRAQKNLFDSFVRLIAGAIDTKSPYTGGHCQRVPVIAGMLADAASTSEKAPFESFQLSEEERYELFIASWLHDCGKVTTPEYVVDKATKLETNYNRIHEIRTRFEVLWRDADIIYYKGIAETPDRREFLYKEREEKQRQLKEDFAFLARCNEGGEFMAPEKIERLQQIGRQQWERNFDHRIGISGDEKARLDMDTDIVFPVRETLLADKPEHQVPRLSNEKSFGDNPWNFKMAVPYDRYNLGELYNLSIVRGTLTPEERYKINDHIVQTIIMLNSLPFPKEIRRVPDWAGNHHEKLDGSGYPRCLTGEQLTVPERIMAVADIFEALTASDRPYKTPKTLSECIKIMSYMKRDGHICPDLFDLLLTSGIYREYAKKYMSEEQLDEVDISKYISLNQKDEISV